MRPVAIPMVVSMLALGIGGSAWASSFDVSGSRLSSGGTQVQRCDTAVDFEFDVVQSGSISVVSHVRLIDVNAACHGGLAHLTLADSAGVAVSSVPGTTLTVSSGTARIELSTRPPVGQVKAVHVVVNS